LNRRGFISLMAGAAAAPLVPWRGLIEPLISLPPRSKVFFWPNGSYYCESGTFSNQLTANATLTQESLEEMLNRMRIYMHRVALYPTQLIVSPQVKHLIDTDPNVRLAARLAGANV
jgi:hypothetical protein